MLIAQTFFALLKICASLGNLSKLNCARLSHKLSTGDDFVVIHKCVDVDLTIVRQVDYGATFVRETDVVVGSTRPTFSVITRTPSAVKIITFTFSRTEDALK